jgi:thioredoxin reductase
MPIDAVDVVIVGAGPAGLSAALILGRCRRSVLLCDAGEPRNAASHALYGFLTRDGTPPAEFLAIGREQLAPYDTVAFRQIEVRDAEHLEDGFAVTLADDSRYRSRKLLLATGVVDLVPQIEGFGALYGRSVFHCPYCDGWQVRDQPLAVYGQGSRAVQLAIELTCWSHDIVLCSDGEAVAQKDRARLKRSGIGVIEDRVERLESSGERLENVVFAGGHILPRHALFFSTGQQQRSHLPEKLGCTFNDRGAVETSDYEHTDVSGLYVAGDASKAVQLAIVAAAEGAKAAFAINTDLLKDDVRRRAGDQ